MDISYLGHSSVKLDDVLIDPWTQELPGMGLNNSHVFSKEEQQAHFLLLTHNHLDHHLGADKIAKEQDATIVAGFELALEYAAKGCKVDMLNVGGRIAMGDWSVYMTKAFHSATSNPSGFILQKNGVTVYHAGDTAFFTGMNRIGEQFDIDVAFLPIGDRFTMGIDEAVHAVKALHPKVVIPIHYNTFPMIAVDENEFKQKVTQAGFKCTLLSPGEKIEI